MIRIIILLYCYYYKRCMHVDLRKSDTGIYTCRAVSETGETARGAALVVETPTNPAVIFHRTPEPSTFPGSPSKPSVTDITDSSVLLSWRASSTHGASPVYAYTVEYFSHDTGEVSSSMLPVRCRLKFFCVFLYIFTVLLGSCKSVRLSVCLSNA